jgi:hypothetical protein
MTFLLLTGQMGFQTGFAETERRADAAAFHLSCSQAVLTLHIAFYYSTGGLPSTINIVIV